MRYSPGCRRRAAGPGTAPAGSPCRPLLDRGSCRTSCAGMAAASAGAWPREVLAAAGWWHQVGKVRVENGQPPAQPPSTRRAWGARGRRGGTGLPSPPAALLLPLRPWAWTSVSRACRSNDGGEGPSGSRLAAFCPPAVSPGRAEARRSECVSLPPARSLGILARTLREGQRPRPALEPAPLWCRYSLFTAQVAWKYFRHALLEGAWDAWMRMNAQVAVRPGTESGGAHALMMAVTSQTPPHQGWEGAEGSPSRTCPARPATCWDTAVPQLPLPSTLERPRAAAWPPRCPGPGLLFL